MKAFFDITGVDRTQEIVESAQDNGLDSIHLLALLLAESEGVDPRAEKWGTRTQEARIAIESNNWHDLGNIVQSEWPDISFGPSQYIILYHYTGDRSSSIDNILSVREYVFNHTEEDIARAAQKLAQCIALSSDGSILGGLVAYNAGSDRRGDPVWMARWSNNVKRYEAKLIEAEQYRDTGIASELDILWGNALDNDRRSAILLELARDYRQASQEQRDALIAIKEKLGLQ